MEELTTEELIEAYFYIEAEKFAIAKAKDERSGGHSAENKLAREQALERVHTLLDSYIELTEITTEPELEASS